MEREWKGEEKGRREGGRVEKKGEQKKQIIHTTSCYNHVKIAACLV